jgi:hypothetical protein
VRARRRLGPHSVLFRYYNRNRIGRRESILEGIVEHLFLVPPRALGAIDVVVTSFVLRIGIHFNFPNPALDVPIVDPSAGPERRHNFTVSNGQKVWCAACGRLGTRRVVACCSPCQGSADVDHPLLGYRLGGSLWLSGQLKNRGLLTLTKERQQQDLAVGKFERIVMGRCLFFVDLPKNRCSVVEQIFPPPQWTDMPGRNFASKGQLGSR